MDLVDANISLETAGSQYSSFIIFDKVRPVSPATKALTTSRIFDWELGW